MLLKLGNALIRKPSGLKQVWNYNEKESDGTRMGLDLGSGETWSKI